jgi:hypothetical protein
MSFRAFVFACQAVMAEEGLSFHVEAAAPESTPADTKARNAQSMAALGPILEMAKGKRR